MPIDLSDLINIPTKAKSSLNYIDDAVSAYDEFTAALERFNGTFVQSHAAAIESLRRFASESEQSFARATASMEGFSTLLAGQQFASDDVLQYSEALTRLSSDLASYRNIETDITDAAIARAIQGRTQMLMQLGITVDKASGSFKRLVAEIQATKNVTDTQAESMAIMQTLMANTTMVNGHYQSSLDSLSAAQRRQRAAWDELKMVIGEQFTPAVAAATERITSIVKMLASINPVILSSLVTLGTYIAGWAGLWAALRIGRNLLGGVGSDALKAGQDIATFSQSTGAATGTLEQLTGVLASLAASISNMPTTPMLAGIGKDVQVALTEIDSLKNKLQNLPSELATAQKTGVFDGLTKEMVDVKQQLADLKTYMDGKVKELTAVDTSGAFAGFATDIETVKASLGTINTALSGVGGQLNESLEASQRLAEAVTKQGAAFERFSTAMGKLPTNIEISLGGIATIEDSLKRLQATVDELDYFSTMRGPLLPESFINDLKAAGANMADELTNQLSNSALVLRSLDAGKLTDISYKAHGIAEAKESGRPDAMLKDDIAALNKMLEDVISAQRTFLIDRADALVEQSDKTTETRKQSLTLKSRYKDWRADKTTDTTSVNQPTTALPVAKQPLPPPTALPVAKQPLPPPTALPVAKQPLPPPTAPVSSTVSTEVVTAVLSAIKAVETRSAEISVTCTNIQELVSTNPFIDVEKIINGLKEVRADLNSNAPKAPMEGVAVPPVTTTDTSISSSQVVVDELRQLRGVVSTTIERMSVPPVPPAPPVPPTGTGGTLFGMEPFDPTPLVTLNTTAQSIFAVIQSISEKMDAGIDHIATIATKPVISGAPLPTVPPVPPVPSAPTETEIDVAELWRPSVAGVEQLGKAFERNARTIELHSTTFYRVYESAKESLSVPLGDLKWAVSNAAGGVVEMGSSAIRTVTSMSSTISKVTNGFAKGVVGTTKFLYDGVRVFVDGLRKAGSSAKTALLSPVGGKADKLARAGQVASNVADIAARGDVKGAGVSAIRSITTAFGPVTMAIGAVASLAIVHMDKIAQAWVDITDRAAQEASKAAEGKGSIIDTSRALIDDTGKAFQDAMGNLRVVFLDAMQGFIDGMGANVRQAFLKQELGDINRNIAKLTAGGDEELYAKRQMEAKKAAMAFAKADEELSLFTQQASPGRLGKSINWLGGFVGMGEIVAPSAPENERIAQLTEQRRTAEGTSKDAALALQESVNETTRLVELYKRRVELQRQNIDLEKARRETTDRTIALQTQQKLVGAGVVAAQRQSIEDYRKSTTKLTVMEEAPAAKADPTLYGHLAEAVREATIIMQQQTKVLWRELGKAELPDYLAKLRDAAKTPEQQMSFVVNYGEKLAAALPDQAEAIQSYTLLATKRDADAAMYSKMAQSTIAQIDPERWNRQVEETERARQAVEASKEAMLNERMTVTGNFYNSIKSVDTRRAKLVQMDMARLSMSRVNDAMSKRDYSTAVQHMSTLAQTYGERISEMEEQRNILTTITKQSYQTTTVNAYEAQSMEARELMSRQMDKTPADDAALQRLSAIDKGIVDMRTYLAKLSGAIYNGMMRTSVENATAI